MRHLIPLMILLALAVPSRVSAQEHRPRPNLGSACFDLALSAEGGDAMHEAVEFIFAPSVSPTQAENQVWKLHGPIRADRAVLWWPLPLDSVGALLLRDGGVLWELRLDARPAVMRGQARQVFPEARESAPLRADATPISCPR